MHSIAGLGGANVAGAVSGQSDEFLALAAPWIFLTRVEFSPNRATTPCAQLRAFRQYRLLCSSARITEAHVVSSRAGSLHACA
jgi:hypothetical protein